MKTALQYLIIIASSAWTVQAYNDDGSCGAPNYSCPQHSPCCSQFGYCGASEWHCAPKHKCLANCWPTDTQPAATWQPDNKPTKQQRKKFIEEETKDDYWLTQSHIGNYRMLQHFPEENFGVYVRCIDPGVVALTYDDGPSQFTPALLNVLDKEGVKATFFILARNLDPIASPQWQKNQQTLRDLVKRGHLMGSHSYNHPNFINVGGWAAEQDMKKADELFKKVLGFYPRLMRPPEGAVNMDIAESLHKNGFYIVNWSHDTNDWRYVNSNPSRSLQYVKSRVPNKLKSTEGDSVILLQHDTYEGTIKVQQDIIRVLKAKGYRFVTLDECIGVSKPYRF